MSTPAQDAGAGGTTDGRGTTDGAITDAGGNDAGGNSDAVGSPDAVLDHELWEAHAVVVDARGLRCPLPVIRLAQTARDAAAGTVIEILATDPAAGADIPAWCRLRSQRYVGAREQPSPPHPSGTVTAYRVRIGAP